MNMFWKLIFCPADPIPGGGGGELGWDGVYSEKSSDIIVLEKSEVYTTKKANIAFALA